MSRRTVVLVAHEPRRFVERVHYNTSPGHGEGVPGGGPETLVTTKATFGFDDDGELFLRSLHPGVVLDGIEDDFPWELQTAEAVTGEPVRTTPEPMAEELELIRTFDPDGFWTC